MTTTQSFWDLLGSATTSDYVRVSVSEPSGATAQHRPSSIETNAIEVPHNSLAFHQESDSIELPPIESILFNLPEMHHPKKKQHSLSMKLRNQKKLYFTQKRPHPAPCTFPSKRSNRICPIHPNNTMKIKHIRGGKK